MTRGRRERGCGSAPPASLSRVRAQAEVAGSTPLPGDHHRLTLRAPEIVSRAAPGQFLLVWCHDPADLDRPPSAAVLRRPLSISRLRPPDRLELLLRVRGVGGALLARKQAGEMLDVIGPLGRGFEIPEEAKLAVIVAGGIGIAPVPFLCDALVARGARVVLLAGATADERLPFPVKRSRGRRATVPELEALGVEVTYTSEAVEGAVVGALLQERLTEFMHAGACFYAVGPRAMMRHVAEITRGHAFLQVSLEERMACGVGACRSCVVPISGEAGVEYLTSCREGPVFDAARIAWEVLDDTRP